MTPQIDPGCVGILAELSGYLDHEVNAEIEAAVEHHLATCALCREELAQLHTLTQAVADLERPAPPPGIRARLLAQAEAEIIFEHIETVWTQSGGSMSLQHTRTRSPLETNTFAGAVMPSRFPGEVFTERRTSSSVTTCYIARSN